MLISTLESEKNFPTQVDNWALVDFVSFAEIAEMIGGITVYVPLGGDPRSQRPGAGGGTDDGRGAHLPARGGGDL